MQENVARQEDSGLGQGRERLFPLLCLDELELFLVKKLLSGGPLPPVSVPAGSRWRTVLICWGVIFGTFIKALVQSLSVILTIDAFWFGGPKFFQIF